MTQRYQPKPKKSSEDDSNLRSSLLKLLSQGGDNCPEQCKNPCENSPPKKQCVPVCPVPKCPEGEDLCCGYFSALQAANTTQLLLEDGVTPVAVSFSESLVKAVNICQGTSSFKVLEDCNYDVEWSLTVNVPGLLQTVSATQVTGGTVAGTVATLTTAPLTLPTSIPSGSVPAVVLGSGIQVVYGPSTAPLVAVEQLPFNFSVVTGYLTVAGSPVGRPSHITVFQATSQTGVTGNLTTLWEISGSVSKKFNAGDVVALQVLANPAQFFNLSAAQATATTLGLSIQDAYISVEPFGLNKKKKCPKSNCGDC